jgi:hypothetical protein
MRYVGQVTHKLQRTIQYLLLKLPSHTYEKYLKSTDLTILIKI